MNQSKIKAACRPIELPGLLVRIKAALIDTLVLMINMTATYLVFSVFHTIPDFSRIAAILFIFLVYEPLCVAFFGGTMGHLMMGIRVKSINDYSSNISVGNAIWRLITKATLGWISFVTVTNNEKKRALHDFSAGSIVLFHRH
jgi:uncharacterized RDD family membrane protein YckC